MKTQNGYLLISLDFELFWGLFDVKTTSDYQTNLKNVREVIPRLVALADQYNITLTFATVGFLFAKNKQELLGALPSEKPTYLNSRFNPYNLIENIGENETDDPFHYAESLIEFIKNNGNHEIASHTFSHYYANEDGQTPEQFEADIIAAVKIAKQKNISIKSIVFPRNQINEAYLKTCAKHGIICYRGIEEHWMFDTHDTKKLDNATHKAFRLTDAYCNVSGYNTYSINELKNCHGIINIPSSKFFRPYSNSFKLLEPLRISRIKKGLKKAAENNEIYHLWWHPHNFGKNMDANFKNLEDIFKLFRDLQKNHGFQSVSMAQLAEIYLSKESQ
ncbi:MULTISPECIES: polysaccharide deacetylase family protein [Bizionia]|uniref:Polysaccharide deacetylase family protein n=1 Tax=Bizionia algoritergicola TaxID=291187 RepID=A0A5D0QYW6_9FLAO|nr:MULTISPECIES: polysaccharide deacetylase family protein [Bizionia]OBX24148.1 polysaccharide deacetylase [Bizionia sp. APA-3]TYB73658.1 polysaccharide deacetylase family protein [Bizionia algoritergicola]